MSKELLELVAYSIQNFRGEDRIIDEYRACILIILEQIGSNSRICQNFSK